MENAEDGHTCTAGQEVGNPIVTVVQNPYLTIRIGTIVVAKLGKIAKSLYWKR